MGRKRKVVDQNDAANEDQATIGNSDTKSDLEKLQSHSEKSLAMEAVIVSNQITNGANPETNSWAGTGNAIVRRSCRLKGLASRPRSLEVEKLVEHVNLVENEKEHEPEVEHASIPREMKGISLEERVDCLVRAASDEYFKSKVCKGEDVVPCPDISYKTLYIDSQKKIEELMDEHYQLVRKLEFANGKIAAYEGMKENYVLVSGLGNGAGVAVNLSPKPVLKSTIPTPPAASPKGANDSRPKRIYKKNKKYTIPSPPAASPNCANGNKKRVTWAKGS